MDYPTDGVFFICPTCNHKIVVFIEDKDIIERDEIIRNNIEFLSDLQYDLKEFMKRIKEYID